MLTSLAKALPSCGAAEEKAHRAMMKTPSGRAKHAKLREEASAAALAKSPFDEHGQPRKR